MEIIEILLCVDGYIEVKLTNFQKQENFNWTVCLKFDWDMCLPFEKQRLLGSNYTIQVDPVWSTF